MSSTHEPPATSVMPQIGDTLVGKYRLEKILGKGGMGIVAAAMHLQLAQRVAIKFLLHPDHPETVARFLREARAAVRLRSEHVARVLDVGQLENDAPYMVMEYLDGQDLLRHVRSSGPLEVADAVRYVLQTCEAIAEAHSIGIIHRDLKPANLFLTTTRDGDECIKVLDFGISKTNEKSDDGTPAFTLTQVDDVLGSPLYMPPEQLKSSRDVDVRSDIWSLGIILYQLLAGRAPWQSGVLHELVLSITMDPPPPLSTFRRDVPPALEAAIVKCLEKKRENRFRNVAELAWAIAEFGPPRASMSAEKATRLLETVGVHVQVPASGPMRALSLSSPTLPSASSTSPVAVAASTADPAADTVSSSPTVLKTPTTQKGRRSSGFVVAALAGVLVIAGLTGYFVRGSTPAPASSSVQAAANVPEASPISSVMPDVVPAREPVVAPNTPPSGASPPSVALVSPDIPSANAPIGKTNATAQSGTNVKRTSTAPATTTSSAPNAATPKPEAQAPPTTLPPKSPDTPTLKDLTKLQ